MDAAAPVKGLIFSVSLRLQGMSDPEQACLFQQVSADAGSRRDRHADEDIGPDAAGV